MVERTISRIEGKEREMRGGKAKEGHKEEEKQDTVKEWRKCLTK